MPFDVIGSELALGGIGDQNVSTTGIIETVLKSFDAIAPADILAGLAEAVQPGIPRLTSLPP